MKIIEFLKSKFLWKNVLIAIIAVFVLGFLILTFLGSYTRHGQSVEVPVLVGYYENEAEELLKNNQLILEVIDSTYLRDTQPGIIVEQTPKAGTKVKHDRIIFVTINAKSKKMVPLPNLKNVSQRQATYTLTSLGFEIGSVEVVPSEFSDLVLEVKHKGVPVQAGEKLYDGSSITLVVGESGDLYSGEMIFVPDLTGLILPDAQARIAENNLVAGYIGFDVEPNSEAEQNQYMVYKQSPSIGESVIPGKRIDIYVTKDKAKLQQAKNEQQEDDFF
jgi:beta-lactam-binding protein with PASTA domain